MRWRHRRDNQPANEGYEGSNEEGKDGKGDGNAMVLAVMDGATVTA